MAYLDDIDQRLLKKGKLGALDVYPQEEKQREDQLSTDFVKNGFKYQIPELLREYEFQGSKENFLGSNSTSINLEQEIYRSLIQIANKREENNTFNNDTNKKQPAAKQLNQFKPALLHIIAKTRDSALQWFKLLASNEPLNKIIKRVPVFNRRAENLPEIIIILYEFQVPITRAVWYIKILAAQSTTLNEVQKKKRQPNADPSNEWSTPLIKFLREIFNRLKVFYGQQTQAISSIEQFLNIENSNLNLLDKIQPNYLSEEKIKNLWEFTLKLTRSLMDQNLLDRQSILEFYLDIFEKNKPCDRLFKLLLIIIVQNMSYFFQSELLSRRLAYTCCRRIGNFYDEASDLTSDTQVIDELPQEKLDETFYKMSSCHFHKEILTILTSIIQSIMLACPQALVWNSIGVSSGEGKSDSPYNGSPLDHLPCSPSQLLSFVSNQIDSSFKEKLSSEFERVEMCIRRRSIAIENKWSTEQLQKISSLNENRILALLNVLDKHNYDSIDTKTVDNLYEQLFKSEPNVEQEKGDELNEYSVIHLLCEWAITTKRNGLHRIFYVILLLKKCQNDFIEEVRQAERDRDSNAKQLKKLKQKCEANIYNLKSQFLLQNILQEFIELRAPRLDESLYESRIQFANAITLFYTLIYFKLFSHDQFFCTLISRGETFRNVIVDDLEALSKENGCMSVFSTTSQQQQQQQVQYQDDDLKFNVQLNIQNQQFSYQQDDQMTSDSTSAINNHQISKMALYALHLPLPNENEYQHEKNQRFVTIYGFGNKKAEIQVKIKKINKDLMRLFSRKESIVLAGSDSSKTLTELLYSSMNQGEANRLQKDYLSLTFYDQYNQVNLVTEHIYSLFINFSTNKSLILPNINHIMFIFDLMEMNMNVLSIILFSIKLLQLLPQIEKVTHVPNESTSRLFFTQYMSQLHFNVVATLRLHLSCLMLWQDLTIQVFRCLYKMVKHVENPKRCTSVEKCVLIFMYEMYTSISYLRVRFPKFREMNEKIKPKLSSSTPKEIEKLNGPNGPPLKRVDNYVFELVSNQEFNLDLIESYLHKDFHKGTFNYFNYFNFVANVFSYVVARPRDDVLRVAFVCNEITNRCHLLIHLWTNAFKAICQRPDPNQKEKEKQMYHDLAAQINLSDTRVQENLKLFCSHLVALNCVNLNDLTIVVVRSCVMAANKSSANESNSSSYADPIALFSCQMIQNLYTTSPKPLIYRPSTYVHRLLVSNSRLMNFNNTFLLVLKGLFVLSTFHNANKTDSKRKSKATNDHILRANFTNDEQLDLNQFASIVLQEICSQNWIKERCLRAGDDLLKQNHLCEAALGKGPQKLWRIICYPENHQLRNINDQCMSTKEIIRNILLNLDMWTLRESLMEFKLMIEMQIEYFVDCLAKTTVDLLIYPEKSTSSKASDLGLNLLSEQNDVDTLTQSSSQHTPTEPIPSVGSTHDFHAPPSVSGKNLNEPSNGESSNASTPSATLDQMDIIDNDVDKCASANKYKPNQEPTGIWLISPLITQLQVTCHGKVLEYTAKTLQDLGKSFWNAKTRVEKETAAQKNLTAWTQLPFFSLLYSCLKCQEDQKKSLLSSLFNQINDYIIGKEDRILHEDPKLKQIMMQTLHIRLSLVGSMFDFILRNQNDHSNWVWLLVQLIHLGVIDAEVDQLLFTIVIDMLAVLIHHILTLDLNYEQNKYYQLIVRKVSKETKDFNDFGTNRGINQVRRLFPLSRASASCDVLTVDTHNPPSSKVSNIDKRRYFKFVKKEKVSCWELIEGVKNASTLCMSWYGVSKLERKVLKYEYIQKLMIHHLHSSLFKERSHFLALPEIPDDLLDEDLIEDDVEAIQPPLEDTNESNKLMDQVAMEVQVVAQESVQVQVPYANIKIEQDIGMSMHVTPQQQLQQQASIGNHHQHHLQQHDPTLQHHQSQAMPYQMMSATNLQLINQQRQQQQQQQQHQQMMMQRPPQTLINQPQQVTTQNMMMMNQQQQQQQLQQQQIIPPQNMASIQPIKLATPEKQKIAKTKKAASGTTRQTRPRQPAPVLNQSMAPLQQQQLSSNMPPQQYHQQPGAATQYRGWSGYGPQVTVGGSTPQPLPPPPLPQNSLIQQRLAQQPAVQRMPFTSNQQQSSQQPTQPDVQLINQPQVARKMPMQMNVPQQQPTAQPPNSATAALKRKFSDIQYTSQQQPQQSLQSQFQSQQQQQLQQQQQQRVMQGNNFNAQPQQLQASKSDLSIGMQKPLVQQFSQMSANTSTSGSTLNQQSFITQQQSQPPIRASLPIQLNQQQQQQQQQPSIINQNQQMYRQQQQVSQSQQPLQRLQQTQSMPYQTQQQQFSQKPNQTQNPNIQQQQIQRPPQQQQPNQYQNYGPQ